MASITEIESLLARHVTAANKETQDLIKKTGNL